jgi:error-prone DNA polymerase
MAINGRVQREGEVVHLIAQELFELSADPSRLADRDGGFAPPTGRGDEFAYGVAGQPRSAREATGSRQI